MVEYVRDIKLSISVDTNKRTVTKEFTPEDLDEAIELASAFLEELKGGIYG